MTRVNFEKVMARRTVTVVCSVCGKKRKRTNTIWQTVSPFNTNANGAPKTRAQVQQSVSGEAVKWSTSVTKCAKCEALQ